MSHPPKPPAPQQVQILSQEEAEMLPATKFHVIVNKLRELDEIRPWTHENVTIAKALAYDLKDLTTIWLELVDPPITETLEQLRASFIISDEEARILLAKIQGP